MLNSDLTHGLTVSPPNRDKLTMRAKPLKTRDLILSLSKPHPSLSKGEAKISCFFSSLLSKVFRTCPRIAVVVIPEGRKPYPGS
jgi:hypothetical protein